MVDGRDVETRDPQLNVHCPPPGARWSDVSGLSVCGLPSPDHPTPRKRPVVLRLMATYGYCLSNQIHSIDHSMNYDYDH